MIRSKETPAAVDAAGRGDDAEFGFGNRSDLTRVKARPQLHRLGETSESIAFLDDACGRPLGWLARGLGGWNAVRMGSGDTRLFSSALRAMRFVSGGRP